MVKSENTLGFQYAAGAFVMWGLLPIYWKLFHHIPAGEVLAHRVIWSIVFVYLILVFQRRKGELYDVLRNRRTVLLMTFSGLLIGSNWFVYIWAVNHDRVLETSMGYFMSPIISILLGFLFLQEKIRGLMIPSVFFALAGVLVTAAGYGHFPFAGVYLAASFGFYGLFRKKVQVKPLPGLFLETLTVAPLAVGYLVYVHVSGGGAFFSDASDAFFLAGSGAATSLPLLLYVAGAARIRLGTVGTLQYIAPTIAFFIGAFMYSEPLDAGKLTTFGLIWAGVILYLVQLYRDSRSLRQVSVYSE